MTRALRQACLSSDSSPTLDPENWDAIRALRHRMSRGFKTLKTWFTLKTCALDRYLQTRILGEPRLDLPATVTDTSDIDALISAVLEFGATRTAECGLLPEIESPPLAP